MDADALIKTTKASLKEDVVASLEVSIPPEVEREAVDQGKQADHGDAYVIERNIEAGHLSVRTPAGTGSWGKALSELGVTGGEAEVLKLHASSATDLLVSDDARFLRTVEGLGMKYATPGALLVLLVELGELTPQVALEKLDDLADHVSEAEHVGARDAIVDRRADHSDSPESEGER